MLGQQRLDRAGGLAAEMTQENRNIRQWSPGRSPAPDWPAQPSDRGLRGLARAAANRARSASRCLARAAFSTISSTAGPCWRRASTRISGWSRSTARTRSTIIFSPGRPGDRQHDQGRQQPTFPRRHTSSSSPVIRLEVSRLNRSFPGGCHPRRSRPHQEEVPAVRGEKRPGRTGRMASPKKARYKSTLQKKLGTFLPVRVDAAPLFWQKDPSATAAAPPRRDRTEKVKKAF